MQTLYLDFYASVRTDFLIAESSKHFSIDHVIFIKKVPNLAEQWLLQEDHPQNFLRSALFPITSLQLFSFPNFIKENVFLVVKTTLFLFQTHIIRFVSRRLI